jgi:hypothetical protein
LEDVGTRGTRTPGRRLKRPVLALALAVCGCWLGASSTFAASFTWSGAAAVGEPKWSNGTNWEGTAPSGSVGTLTFPALTSAACTEKLAKATCYQGENDVGELSVNAISIDDVSPYRIIGNAIILGSGGITASTSSSSSLSTSPPFILAPIALSASQVWSIDGNNVGGQLDLEGNLSGSTSALTVNLARGTFLGIRGDAEVGPVSVTAASTSSGWIALGDLQVAAKLNASDGNTISFGEGAGLFAVDSTTGPLTFLGGNLQVGEAPGGGTLQVVGSVTFDSASAFQASINKPGTSAGTDYTQLSASGTVKLGQAKLNVYGLAFPEGGGTGHCPTLKVGDVDTLVTTTGALEGTFTGVPNGTEVQETCSPGTGAKARINYTEHAVTATITTPGSFTGSSSPAQAVNAQSSSGSGAPGGSVLGSTSSVLTPALAQRQSVSAVSGTATIRLKGTSTFVPLAGSTSIPDGSEVDATKGRVVITAATPSGKTVSAEVYDGRFRVHQDSSGETHFTLTLPLTGCARVALPHGSAAALGRGAKHSSKPKSRHVWVSEGGGKWGTNGRYVSTSVEGTTWLTLDECTQSRVKVTAGKVKVRDLARKKTKMIAAGHSYVAAASRRRHA